MNLHPKTSEAYNLLHDGCLALSRAEQQGFRVDMEYIQRKNHQLTRKIKKLEGKFKDTKFYHHWQHSSKGAVNIHSNTQLSHFLYKIKKLKPVKLTTSEQGSTDEDALKQLNIPELNDLLYIRKLKKVQGTYLDAFSREQVNGYIHPFFNLNTVVTYRSSSDRPNFQNIPKRDKESMNICRQALYPRPGHQLLEIDFSGLEVRISACYNNDPNLIKYVSDKSTDMHRDMAIQLFKLDKFNPDIHGQLRQAAKNGFVFPEFYGDYFKNCADGLLCDWGKLPKGRWSKGQGIEIGDIFLSDHLISKGLKEFGEEKRVNGKSVFTGFLKHVKEVEDDFWGNRFAAYTKWKERWWEGYKKYGYIDLKTGFRCSGVMSRNDCINYPVQGAAFHCLLWSLIQMDMFLMPLDSKLIGQIHDSMIIDVNPKELKQVALKAKEVTCVELSKHWDWINVPLDVEMELSPVDGSWAEKEKFKL